MTNGKCVIYWLELLKETEYLSKEQFDELNDSAIEIIKLIASNIKTVKSNINI
ncbi:MAG: four helix bundle protein [Bacteroidetes bacterium]|nr:four helix bundle protein [Bacteroidota bacterium]MDA1120037.1 four helix bundle protein [Bacteroidota bacterium]